MVNWKTIVNPVYIQEHDNFDNICIYNSQTGANKIKIRSELKDLKETWRGFFKQNGGAFIGVFATNKGAVFFVNENMYLLNENDWDFVVQQSTNETNIFRFTYNGKVIYKTQYKKVKDLGVHYYADEEFMDFFTWMSQKKTSKTFLDYYIIK